MSIQQTIKGGIKDAMIAKDQVRLGVLRGLSAAFTNELVAKKMKPDGELSDEDALAVVTREAKKRKDSIEQFEKGGRSDLAEDEKAELAIIETFLPAQMSKEEIESFVRGKQAELNMGKDKAGQFTGLIMKELKGKADGQVVKQIVDSLFA